MTEIEKSSLTAVAPCYPGIRTFAEIPPNPDDPGALLEMLERGSIVFVKPSRRVDIRSCSWWRFILGADWRHPLGPDSSIDRLEKHPVTHVAYRDVEAHARWAGKELPTEADWEFAARGELDEADLISIWAAIYGQYLAGRVPMGKDGNLHGDPSDLQPLSLPGSRIPTGFRHLIDVNRAVLGGTWEAGSDGGDSDSFELLPFSRDAGIRGETTTKRRG